MPFRRSLLLILVLLGSAVAALAMPDPPGPATVYVARSEKILVPQGISAPRVLYPQGRVDFDIVEKLVDMAVAAVAGVAGPPPEAPWRALFRPTDRIGIMVDAGTYPVQLASVETVIDRLVNSGISPANIVVFSGDERDLFVAGFNISRDPKTVRVLGGESEGYRGNVSRIISDYCDAIINISTLKVDPEIGFSGCLANTLYSVPTVQRVALRRDVQELPSVAALPGLRQKLRLNLLEAYLPLLDLQGKEKVTCQYGALLAGTDPVAVDVIGRQILQGCRNAARTGGWPLPAAADYLQPAQDKYRVGQADRKQITVKVLGYMQDSLVD